MIETIWWIIVFIGAAGGLGFLIQTIRDLYMERKWAKQWSKELDHYAAISLTELKRIIDRQDDGK